MKKLAFLLAFLPSVAFAQVGPEVYRVASPSQVLGYGTSATTLTTAVVHQIVRLTCTTACYLWINASGQNFTPTATTGVYLPAAVPALFSVSPNSKIKVLRDTTNGNLHVQELTR